MNRDTLIGLVAVIVIIGGLIAWGITRPNTAKAPATGGIATSTLPASGAYTENSAYYEITANYATSTPLVASAGANADTQAVTLMQSWVQDSIAQFKKDGNFANLTPDDIHTLGFDQGRKYTFQINYLIASSENTASYIYTTYEDTGGAHGNTFFTTFVFDKTTGAHLALADLFTPGADYLGLLSQIARARLPGIIGQYADNTFIKEGTTPDEKNFQDFFYDGTDFVLLFPPYQVAAYAAGPQTLRIPNNQLYSILKTQYR